MADPHKELEVVFMKPDANGRPQFTPTPILGVTIDEAALTWSHPDGVTFGRAPRAPITKKIGEWTQVWPEGQPHPGAIGVCLWTPESVNQILKDLDEIRHSSM